MDPPTNKEIMDQSYKSGFGLSSLETTILLGFPFLILVSSPSTMTGRSSPSRRMPLSSTISFSLLSLARSIALIKL